MDIKWKTLFIKTLTWLAAEIVLNSMGLDTLADYGEFVLEQNGIINLAGDCIELQLNRDRQAHNITELPIILRGKAIV